MFSLSYTPAYDPYHTAFRYLVILSSAENSTLSYRAARTADFFLCFPWALSDVRAPRNVKGFAKERNSILKLYPQSNYEKIPKSRIIFERMEVIQATAVSALAGADIIDSVVAEHGQVSLVVDSLSDNLLSSIKSFQEKHSELVELISKKLPQFSELGKDGIFARSGLGEHSYDIV